MDSVTFISGGPAGLFVLATIFAVVIAYGVHFLLTLLSVATGVSFTPNLKKSYAQYKAKQAERKDDLDHGDQHDEDGGSDAITITGAVGLWVLITASIALFMGTYLGFSILPITGHIPVVAGLVVWSLFFFSLIYFEFKAANSVVGGLLHTALAGVRQTGRMASSIMSKSEASRTEDQVRRSTRAIFEEVARTVRKDNLDEKLEDYVHRLTPNVPNLADIRKELYALINKIEVEERVSIEDEDVLRLLDVHINKDSKINKENLKRLKDSYSEGKGKASEEERRTQKLAAIIDHIAPVDDEQSRQLRGKIADILNKTSNEELNAEAFERDLEQAFDDPKAGKDQVLARLKHFDRATIREIVNELNDLPEDKSNRYVDMALSGIDKLMLKTAGAHRASFPSFKTSPAAVEKRIEAYFDGMGQEGLRYHAIKRDVQSIMEEPTSAPSVVKQRLAQLDRNAAIALLSANPMISEEQATKIADQVMAAKEGALSTLDTVNAQIEKSQRQAVIMAEKARRNTVAASWWLVISSIASGAAAVAGAYFSNTL